MPQPVLAPRHDSDSATSAQDGFPVRTTVVLTMSLDRNLEVYCAQAGVGKSKLIEKVLYDFLVSQGLNPDKIPKSVNLHVSY